MAFQLRRGTNAQRLGLTPLQGELIYTTDTKALYVGDGTTAGGTSVGGGGGGATDLNDLTDVVITGGTLASGQVLKYNGTNWVNGTDSTGGGGGAVDSVNGEVGDVVLTTTDIAQGTNEYYTQQKAQDATASLFDNGTHTGITFVYDDLTNSISATVTGGGGTTENQVLDWVGPMLEDGINTGITFTYDPLTNGLTSTVDVTVSELSDVTIIGTLAQGEILRYDAVLGGWVNDVMTLENDPAPTLGASLSLSGYSINGTGSIEYQGNFRAEGEVIVGGPANYTGGLTVVSQADGSVNPIFDVVTYVPGGSNPILNFSRARGTRASAAPIALGDAISTLRFIGLGSNITADPKPAAQIIALVDPSGTVGTDFAPGAIAFQTANNSGTLNTVLSLNKDGQIRVAAIAVDPSVVNETAPVKYLPIRVTTTGTSFITYYMPLFAAL